MNIAKVIGSRRRFGVAAVGLAWLLIGGLSAATAADTPAAPAWLAGAERHEKGGWIYLHVEGSPRACGRQHGYLLAAEIGENLRVHRISWRHQTSLEWSWLAEQATTLFAGKIDPENLEELDGIVEGLAARGVQAARADLIALNGWIELSAYWWPQESRKFKEQPQRWPRQSCSAFIATGKATRDGGVVLAHNTMSSYDEANANVILDLQPERGHRILMQVWPGWIHSGTDFFVTDAGLVGAETTIGEFDGFDANGIPEFVRMRRATQDAGSIDQWCEIMRKGNNGGYANAWLLGDVRSGEIARLELGLHQVGFERTRDGVYTGSNVAEDLRLLRFETGTQDTDIRLSSVARRVRWNQLMERFAGRIDTFSAQQFEADHFDAYLGRSRAGSRSLCGHFELDAQPWGSWPGAPFSPAGTFDAKVVDSALAKRMSILARWGSACGRAFDAAKFLSQHPQFQWMKGILKSRPSQPWVEFKADERS